MLDILGIINNTNDRYDGDMRHYFRTVMNAPNTHGPYHNIRHMLHVTWEAYDAGIHLGLTRLELRLLLIAAIMHDYGHLCGSSKTDRDNIERAVEGFVGCVQERDRPYLHIIVCIIRHTEFNGPSGYVDLDNESIEHVSEKGSFLSLTRISGDKIVRMIEILRDCDMSQTFSPVWIQSVLYGLSKEIGLTPMQMLEMQEPFLSSMQFRTTWGRYKFAPLIPERIQYVRSMLETIKGDEP